MKNRILNPYGEDFRKPAILIANHQSFIDSLAVCMLYPKVVVFVNSWTWKSPFFGLAIRYADFFYIGQGVEYSGRCLNPGQERLFHCDLSRGNPVGNGKIGRFHKGAFLLSQEMKLDIIP
jgi:1-acyl-sn-glycerol-3-phosphate acyltransferase